MKKLLLLSLIFAVVVIAGIGSLMIFEILSLESGLDYMIKAVAAIVLIGGASAVVVLVTDNNRAADD